MNVKSVAINSFAKFMIGGKIFDEIKSIVKVYSNSNLSGEEKRKQAIKDVFDIVGEISLWIVSLGIELAVAYFKTLEKK